MELPSALYRSVNGYHAFRNHFEGNLWFRSHAYFRKLEGGDELEGIGSYDIRHRGRSHDVSDDYPIQPAYFMSFSEDPNAAKEYGDHHLRLVDPDGLLEEIKAAFPSCSGFVRVAWIKIDYGKTMGIEKDPGPSEGFHRQFHCKPKKFASEREWRLQIRFIHSFRVQNQTLKFRWPSIGKNFSRFHD